MTKSVIYFYKNSKLVYDSLILIAADLSIWQRSNPRLVPIKIKEKKENNTNSKENIIEKRYENSALFKGNLNIKKENKTWNNNNYYLSDYYT